jgi:hypothetical protein
MIAFPPGVKVWIAGGVTDMRRGMNTLALQVQEGQPAAGTIPSDPARLGGAEPARHDHLRERWSASAPEPTG